MCFVKRSLAPPASHKQEVARMRTQPRPLLALAAALIFAAPTFSFQSPLSEESIREAYFLGQRHDDALPRLLDKYVQHLALPKTGPYISSIAFFTPFALVAQNSSQHSFNYSAQQAQIDHRAEDEYVVIRVQIDLTETYGAYLTVPTGSRSGSPIGIRLRPSSFWKEFQVEVSSDDKYLNADSFQGEPSFLCGEGACILSGATLTLEFPARTFTSDTATVLVTPPEGDPVQVDFDLTTLR